MGIQTVIRLDSGAGQGGQREEIYVLTWTILATKLYKLDICLNLWVAC